MKLPFIKYIEGMVFAKYNFDTIKKKLNETPIPLAKDIPISVLEKVYYHLADKDPDYLRPPYNEELPNLDLLKERKVYDLYFYLTKKDPGYRLDHIRGAFDLLFDQDMFLKMSALALANVTQEDIELIVRSKYNVHFNEEEMKNFLLLFFNTEGWTLSDKKNYLKFVNDPVYKEFYELAIEGDKAYLMWKLGIAPQVSFESMLQDVISDTYYLFKEKVKYNPQQAKEWASLMGRMIERAEKLQSEKKAASDFFKDLETLLKQSKQNVEDLNAAQNQPAEPDEIPHLRQIAEEEDE